jgi:hypothetical protein
MPFATFQGIVIGQNAFGESAPVPSTCMSVARSRPRQAVFLVWSSRIDWTSDQSGRFDDVASGPDHDFADTGRSINASFEGARGLRLR